MPLDCAGEDCPDVARPAHAHEPARLVYGGQPTRDDDARQRGHRQWQRPRRAPSASRRSWRWGLARGAERAAAAARRNSVLLLIMDVCRSGRLSYAEWVRGVLSLPEVLVCFQLAIPLPNGSALPGSSSECRGRGANHVASSPFTTHPPAASADGSAHHSAGLVLVGFGSQRAPVDNPYLVANGSALAAAATVAASASERASRITESLTSVHTSLWLRSMRALLANLGCGAS